MQQATFDFIRQEQQLGFGFGEKREEMTAEKWAERLAEDREENERTYRRSN